MRHNNESQRKHIQAIILAALTAATADLPPDPKGWRESYRLALKEHNKRTGEMCNEIAGLKLKLEMAKRATADLRADKEPWLKASDGPESCSSALAMYAGVQGPNIGFIVEHRFFPYGQCGSLPYTHWMPIPPLPDAAREQEGKG